MPRGRSSNIRKKFPMKQKSDKLDLYFLQFLPKFLVENCRVRLFFFLSFVSFVFIIEFGNTTFFILKILVNRR